MQLGRAISWLIGGLQRSLFPKLEDCWNTPLTENEKKLISILKLIKIEAFILRTAFNQWMGRTLKERESIARSFVAKVVYGYPTTRALEVSRRLGHVPIIDKNGRGKETIPMAPHEAARYNERTAVERFNSRIKKEFGADNIMVRGAEKVKMHLMFGVLALFGDHLIKLAT
jgi:hypothetical protein